MFGCESSRLRVGPRDLEVLPPLTRSKHKHISSANIINSTYASTKLPLGSQPLPLYNADGTMNHLNHYFYTNHLSYYDRMDGAHRQLFDADGVQKQHYHHPVTAINLELIDQFSRRGRIQPDKNPGQRDLSPWRVRAIEEAGSMSVSRTPFDSVVATPVDAVNPFGSLIGVRKRRLNAPGPPGQQSGTGWTGGAHTTNQVIPTHQTTTSSRTGQTLNALIRPAGRVGPLPTSRRYFSFNWRAMFPISRRIFSRGNSDLNSCNLMSADPADRSNADSGSDSAEEDELLNTVSSAIFDQLSRRLINGPYTNVDQVNTRNVSTSSTFADLTAGSTATPTTATGFDHC
ncbi:uncharacterized protein V1516DRAFT_680185 [Lipomyces oligophaga]|uniref:uncharacterized protein n=1 Tax=Lipomyces oligophaga TaxID=45792 RepID=UPI0034CFF3B7